MTPRQHAPDAAATSGLPEALARVAESLERHADSPPYDTTAFPGADWAVSLDAGLPREGWGAERVLDLLSTVVIEHGLPADQGSFHGWIFAAPPVVPTVARTVAARVGSQRYMLFANGLLEGVALAWLKEAFHLDGEADAVFVSSGTVANTMALGAARQRLYERLGVDPARDGLAGLPPATLYGSEDAHHCLLKAAGMLGVGRSNVRMLPSDDRHRLRPEDVRAAILDDRAEGRLPMAVVANAGSTNTGSIDPISELADLCDELDVWLHVDGAYGLPGMLDERVAERYAGLDRADSTCTDLHKWLNVPTGTGVTFVKERGLLGRAFTGEPSEYIEGQFAEEHAASGWDTMGPPYHEMSPDLSAPSFGVVVWAALAEIGVEGFAARVRRHRDCARLVHDRATEHPRLESLVEPELSVANMRYVAEGASAEELDDLNAAILARLRIDGTHAPSGTTVNGVFAIRPCFLSAWTGEEHADALVDAVLAAGDDISATASGAVVMR